MAQAQRRKPYPVIRGGRKQPVQQQTETEAQYPCNPEAERVTIGTVIEQPESREIVPLLETNDFYLPEHRPIWDAITTLYERGEPITTVALDSLLSTRKQLSETGGQLYLQDLRLRAMTLPDDPMRYARIVFDRSCDRQMIDIGAEFSRLGYQSAEDREGVMAYHRAQLADLEERALAFDPVAKRLPGKLASEVEDGVLEWLWYHRLAYGMLSLLDGDPGLGKGLIEVYLAARMSTGSPLPGDLDQRRREPANVILISPEDIPEITIKPRLVAAGADLSRVRIVTAVEDRHGRERAFTLPSDTGLLRKMIEQDDARLVVIDPIMACLDEDVETKNDQKVRGALLPLKQAIEHTRAACLLVRHLNKTGNDKALYRGGGSIAFTGLCRTTFLLAEHPDNRAERVLASVKSNLRGLAPSLAFSIVAPHEDADAHIVWNKEPVAYDADALLGAQKSDQRMDIIKVLQANAPIAMTPHDVALALGLPPEKEVNIRNLMGKMAKAGDIRKPSYGAYTV